MLQSHLGEISALLTAIFWTVTALSFERAGKLIGSLAVNWIRMFFGMIFLSFFTWVTRGMFLPIDADMHAWCWLSISGVIGFVVGDVLLFQAFVLIGSRISMLIMALVPPITTLISWLIMGETLSVRDFIGMALVVGGIALVVIENPKREKGIKFSHPVSGILFALGGAAGQAVGLVLSKYGMGDYNAFASTQIRIFAGFAGMSILYFFLKAWPKVRLGFKHPRGLLITINGAFWGPFLGVSFSLLAVQHALAGVASTIMAIVPVLIIPPAMILFKEKINAKEVMGAVIAVLGVGVLFLQK
jgi:drug/metabolite transporter (DMT)-like permease